uniref:Ash family protein n=1 Tax=Panagrellus redivivus TaxID=6233 RepID=A0A7E4V5E2_PANRE
MAVGLPTKAMIKVNAFRNERFGCCKATYANALTAPLASQVASLIGTSRLFISLSKARFVDLLPLVMRVHAKSNVVSAKTGTAPGHDMADVASRKNVRRTHGNTAFIGAST